MKRISITSLCLLSLTISAFSQKAWKVEHEKQIRQRITQFVDDINTANAEGFVDAFSDKLYSASTKEALKASVIERSKYYDVRYSIHLNEVKVDQKMAFEEGWFRSELLPKKSGDPIIQEFDFLDVWALESDGKWRIVKAMKKERPLKEYKAMEDLTGETAQIAGSYATDKFPVDIKITTSDQIVLIVNNGSPIKLKKTSALKYNLEGVSGAELRFELGKDGIAEKAIMKQPNGEVVADRL